MIPDDVIIRAGTNMLAHTDMVPLDYVRQALAEVRELPHTVNTHGPDCWGWGPKHYECAVNRIERLVEALRLALKWAEAVPPGEPLYKESEADLSAARAALRDHDQEDRNGR